MALGGWRNSEIMQRYGRANAASRAMDEYRKSKAVSDKPEGTSDRPERGIP